MDAPSRLRFTSPALLDALQALDDAALDALDFGVIGFDSKTLVRRYNAFESRSAGLRPDEVIGRPFFTDVAQCMNNFLVAQRFEDARAAQEPLDAVVDFVLSWRMRPTAVRLRLLASPASALAYVVLERRS